MSVVVVHGGGKLVDFFLVGFALNLCSCCMHTSFELRSVPSPTKKVTNECVNHSHCRSSIQIGAKGLSLKLSPLFSKDFILIAKNGSKLIGVVKIGQTVTYVADKLCARKKRCIHRLMCGGGWGFSENNIAQSVPSQGLFPSLSLTQPFLKVEVKSQPDKW